MTQKLYNLISDSFAELLPENSPFCTRKEIDSLHRYTCEFLEIIDIYPEVLWSFTDKMRTNLAEASYWTDPDGKPQWRVVYDTKKWIAMGKEGRKNTIIHEVCHLAVEKLYGHRGKPEGDKPVVTDHGEHWQELMTRCGEEPFKEDCWRYR
jgi:hypothetical protein